MLIDSLTVARKELKELLLQQASGGSRLRGGWLGLLSVIGVFGVFLPLQMGLEWVGSPTTLIYWAWVPLFLVSSATADSFAGERERHTLETLLASRLSDRAILLGKVAAVVVYGWGITLFSLGLGLVTVNLANTATGPHFYPIETVVAGTVLGFLAAVTAAAAGVLVSLRAATVRQAAQITSIGTMVILFGGIFGVRALPNEIQVRLLQWVTAAGPLALISSIALGLTLLDLLLLFAALQRFQRARLILD